jgi:predicted transcriptional regulator of viral defense system
MNQLEFLNKNVFFTTRQFAFAVGISIETASRQLNKLKKINSIISVTRGLWAQTHHPYYSPYGAVSFLLGKEQGYVSFLTALHRHDVISQIPVTIQIATTGHSRKLKSRIANFEFFHIQPSLMRHGIDVAGGKLFYKMASPSKALFDCMYLSTRKGRRFLKMPELNLSLKQKNDLQQLIHLSPASVSKLMALNLNDKIKFAPLN